MLLYIGFKTHSSTVNFTNFGPHFSFATSALLDFISKWSTKNDGHTRADSNCSSHFPLFYFTAAGKKNARKTDYFKLSYVHDLNEILLLSQYHEMTGDTIK